MAKVVNHSWEALRTVTFGAAQRLHHRSFCGTAELFTYTGDDQRAGLAAVVTFYGEPPENYVDLMCGGSGYVAEAVLFAAGLRRQYKHGGAKAWHTQWGGPIGCPADELQQRRFVLVFYRR